MGYAFCPLLPFNFNSILQTHTTLIPAQVIISMKAGIGHLQDKLESFREEIKGQSYTVSDDTVTEVCYFLSTNTVPLHLLYQPYGTF